MSGMRSIDDGEMVVRINIEASAAMADWVDLFRAEERSGLYARLVDRAVYYLPMPQRSASRTMGPFSVLRHPEVTSRLVDGRDASWVARVRAETEQYPSRVFANALINTAWRNGPVEDIHAGIGKEYPLSHRRVTLSEERDLMRFTSGRLSEGMMTCFMLVTEEAARPWPEQVLPYGLAELLLITPSGWTVTEVSREILLPQ